MKRIAVLSVDHIKANFFMLRAAERPAEQWSPILEPKKKMINQHWMNQRSETLSGGTRFSYHVGLSGMAQTMHGYDDHLARHQREICRKFTRELNEQIKRFISQHQAQELIIVADRKILGDLRQHMGPAVKLKIEVNEIAANLTNLSPVELHEHLSELGALPHRNPPSDPQSASHSRSGQWRRRGAPDETGYAPEESSEAE
jgi:protein required for attachment to host cells